MGEQVESKVRPRACKVPSMTQGPRLQPPNSSPPRHLMRIQSAAFWLAISVSR